jgi:hypothetical protein
MVRRLSHNKSEKKLGSDSRDYFFACFIYKDREALYNLLYNLKGLAKLQG